MHMETDPVGKQFSRTLICKHKMSIHKTQHMHVAIPGHLLNHSRGHSCTHNARGYLQIKNSYMFPFIEKLIVSQGTWAPPVHVDQLICCRT